MENGSIASICYFSNGSKKLSKEGLDDIFAELFSLVNLDSVEGDKKNLTQNINTNSHVDENFLIKNDQKF